jgi:hypothetical protein
MCPFCIGAAAWAAAGAVSAGGLGMLAAFVHRERADARSDGPSGPGDSTTSAERTSQA